VVSFSSFCALLFCFYQLDVPGAPSLFRMAAMAGIEYIQ
jgi:hypothetical protein